jgi:hypothetical protein
MRRARAGRAGSLSPVMALVIGVRRFEGPGFDSVRPGLDRVSITVTASSGTLTPRQSL